MSDSDLLRVLVVDDSPVNRQRIIRIVEASGIARVVGTAANGSEALKAASMLQPEAITLDLQMPQMDGFSFLRLLMSSRPTPVLVVSSNDRPENVFKALELGAVDFVSKSENGSAGELAALLVSKLRLVRSVRHSRPSIRPPPVVPQSEPVVERRRRPRYVVGIASSTGGPTAVTEVLSRVTGHSDYAVLIAQHMPPKFTTTFAQRLNRYCALTVSEAQHGEPIYAGRVLVCPGNRCMEVEMGSDHQLVVRLFTPTVEDRYVPNATRLLASVGRVMGARSIGVVLTGMGDDGAEGARVIAERKGRVLVESEKTAVVYGMPRVAAQLVPSARSVPLSDVAPTLMGIVRGDA